MGKLKVFNFITLNGFYKGIGNDISWHKHGEEEARFSEKGVETENTLVFGRTTYEMMADYWRTPEAKQTHPRIADGMNKAQKIVFSRTMQEAAWENTTIIRHNLTGEIKQLKRECEMDMTILGSGSITSQLAEAGLIDEYQLMIDPVAIGEGIPVFCDIKGRLELALMNVQTFKSGVVLLTYQAT